VEIIPAPIELGSDADFEKSGDIGGSGDIFRLHLDGGST
jgi:hypothetical protein